MQKKQLEDEEHRYLNSYLSHKEYEDKQREHQALSKRKTRENEVVLYNKQAEDMKKRLKEVEFARERDFLKMYNDHQDR